MIINTKNIKFTLSELFNKSQDFEIKNNEYEDYFILKFNKNILTISDNYTGFETYIEYKNDEYVFSDNYSDATYENEKNESVIVFDLEDNLYYIDDETLNDEENEIQALFG